MQSEAGALSIRAAKTGCTVIANEQNQVALQYLKKNIELNNATESILLFALDPN